MMRTANVSWNRLGNALTGATFSIIAMSAGFTTTLAAIGTAKFFLKWNQIKDVETNEKI